MKSDLGQFQLDESLWQVPRHRSHELPAGNKESANTGDNLAALLTEAARLKRMPRVSSSLPLASMINHRYLQDHCIDDVPVLPAAAALEIMAETVTELFGRGGR